LFNPHSLPLDGSGKPGRRAAEHVLPSRLDPRANEGSPLIACISAEILSRSACITPAEQPSKPSISGKQLITVGTSGKAGRAWAHDGEYSRVAGVNWAFDPLQGLERM
jgi:hypothetical protein